MTERQYTTERQLSLKTGFEPQRGAQEALSTAYERLLPSLSRCLSATPTMRLTEESHDMLRISVKMNSLTGRI